MADKSSDSIKENIKNLPEKPGVYQFYDKNGNILYVGKAKNLKKRVSSYFNKHHESGKTRVLVKKIREIRHVLVENESDALLLENSLIKKWQPRYNVMLKDDKTYPWLCIKNESFPRIFLTRRLIKDGSEYFGPYTSVKMVKTLLDFIRQLYPVRTCNYLLSPENISSGKYKKCLEYHIGNCLAPCEGLQNEENYLNNIREIRSIIRGDLGSVQKRMTRKMKQMAEAYRFEEAALIKEKLKIIENYRSKSTVVNPRIHNLDVYSMVSDLDKAFVNFLKISNGAIIQAHTLELKKQVDESPEDLLSTAILEIRHKLNSESREAIVPFQPAYAVDDLKYTVPQRGDKKKLLELSERNAKYYMLEVRKQIKQKDPSRHRERILETLQKDLHLQEKPNHIECFDNSNIQGTHPVSACVVFLGGKPAKAQYRHYNIKTVQGPDDYASMKEVLLRRYKRLLDENKKLPQLIIIDGGKGQLSAAVEALEALNLRGKIAIIGIAKRLEEIYFPGDSLPLYLDKNSESLKLIQYARNEAHRFSISFHRQKRSHKWLDSELSEIPGIGKKTIERLLETYGSVSEIKKQKLTSLIPIVGKKKAKQIIDYFTK